MMKPFGVSKVPAEHGLAGSAPPWVKNEHESESVENVGRSPLSVTQLLLLICC